MGDVSGSIRFDARSFLVRGRRTFLRAGEVHYGRVPRGLWRDVLEKAISFGLNAIQTYVPWNWHEPVEGRFEFDGEKDLGAFLDLIAELGLYTIVRPGPYICGEWDFGGIPAWILQKRGAALRRLNPVYLKYADRYLDAVLPIISRREIHRGGSVILVQVENELGGGGYGSPAEDRAYLAYLRDGFRRRGIEVPLLTCSGWVEGTLDGINSFEPASKFAAHRVSHPGMPLYSTEFWSGWDDTWFKCTAEVVPAERVERETWRILAEGGAGWSYFMFHGGTNFGHTAQFLQVTSYDDHAPLTEAGGFGEKYAPLSVATRYARWFGELLLESDPGPTSGAKGAPSGIEVRRRRHRLGSLWFFRNPGNETASFDLGIGGLRFPGFSVPPRMVRPVLSDLDMAGGVRLLGCSGLCLGYGTSGGEPYLAVTGKAGEAIRVVFKAPKRPDSKGDLEGTWSKGAFAVDAEPGRLKSPKGVRLLLPSPVNLLVVPASLAARAHEVEGGMVVGPYRVRASESGPVMGFREGDAPAWAWTPPRRAERLALPAVPGPPDLPSLPDWSFAEDGPEASETYDDAGWTVMWDPINRGFLGDTKGYAWYRATFEWAGSEKRLWTFIAEHADPIAMAGMRAKEGAEEKTITFEALSDRALIFLNGRLVETTDPPEWSRFVDPFVSLRMRLRRGTNTLAVLTDNLGHAKGVWQIRDKLRPGKNFEDDVKGLAGEVSIGWGRDSRVNPWRYRAGLAGEIAGWFDPARQDAAPWRPARQAPPEGRLRWWKTTFSLPREELEARDRPILLKPEGMSKGWIYLNGVNLGRYWMTGIQDVYYLPKPWLRDENLLVLFEETGAAPDRVSLARDAIARVSLEAPLPAPGRAVSRSG